MAVALPDPRSRRPLVSHLLFLDGQGRATPFTSTTELRKVAAVFAKPSGKVWQTSAQVAQAAGATHITRKDLLHLLKGRGKGRARWNDPIEVAQARAYVQRWSEHLLDWTDHPDVAAGVSAAFR